VQSGTLDVPASTTQVPTISATSASTPILGEGFQDSRKNRVSQSADGSDMEPEDAQASVDDTKPGKRRLFGFGKKKSHEKGNMKKEGKEIDAVLPAITDNATASIAQSIVRRVAPIASDSPPRSHPNYPYQSPSSPQRNIYSSSPRVISPAGSQIFERDVQESSLPVPNSSAIPSHIQTENHIPAVLDASSEAITNDSLDPDSVEIVMHSAHQPAAVTVTGVLEQSWTSSWADELISHPDKDDTASNYGTLDSSDVRRLSFISFSDIVQSEHAEHIGSRDSIYVAGLSSLSSGHNRSPSPIRSPVSSQGFSISPPTSKSASIKGFDMSPRGKPLGSPISTHPSLVGGELTIETSIYSFSLCFFLLILEAHSWIRSTILQPHSSALLPNFLLAKTS
jgi:hypothetical protein